MTHKRTRRTFLGDVGRGMLLASLGPSLLKDLSLGAEPLGEDRTRLSFGALEPLAQLFQESSPEQVQARVVERLKAGVDLRTIVAAGALANARAFGGEDYNGYHAFMALTPAYEMAMQLPAAQRALPVLKVLHRNATFLQQTDGDTHDTLRPIAIEHAAPGADALGAGTKLRELVRARDLGGAEAAFVAHAKAPAEQAFDLVQAIVHDDIEVHRVMLAWRAWDVLRLTGAEHANTLLRQTIRFCIAAEPNRRVGDSDIRVLLPQLVEQHRLLDSRPLGSRAVEDAWIAELSQVIFAGERAAAASAVATALADGYAPEAIGEAISLAANRLVLRDPGRKSAEGAAKPRGSVHGASTGVHASDSANAWRNIARVTTRPSAVASLIVGAHHTAGQSGRARSEPFTWTTEAEKLAVEKSGASLLSELDAAVRANQQARACAVVERYAALGEPAAPVFERLLQYA
ncbi:MAG: hypothetical protein ACKVX7_19885, partial [Planctomycetota bacterium]